MPFLRIFVLLFCTAVLQAQQLFEPKEIIQAIEHETRTRNGMPGENYWQNTSDYFIQASYNPDSVSISGMVSVLYTNNSPDTLKQVYFKLMQNVYAKGSARAWEIKKENLTDGVEIGNLWVDSILLKHGNLHINSTLLRVNTRKSILPKTSVLIQVEFVTPMQKSISYRTGALDSSTVFAGYWFPQLCVYDDIFGWDKNQYMLNAENYNDFSNYLVELTLPPNYVVWASGKQVNPEETFQSNILRSISKSQKSEKVVHIITNEDYEHGNVLVEADSLTWKFEAKNLPDFAWGASTHFLWDAVSAKNPTDKKLCWVQSAYPEPKKRKDDKNIVHYAKKSIEHFSQTFPGVPYPYASHVSFLGGGSGGMEFPMIANNTSYDSTFTPVVTAHEIAHNYFPFYMGINEREFGWFDEMFTTQMENNYIKTNFTKIYTRSLKSDKRYANRYNGIFSDLPLMVESIQINNRVTMVNNFYQKGNDMMNALKSVIGDANLTLYLQEFIEIWAGKHPTPYDFFYFVNAKSLVNLNWFWDKWAFRYGSVDLKIAASDSTFSTFIINNVGGKPVPFKIEVEYEDGSLSDAIYNAGIWENTNRFVWNLPENKPIKKVEIKVENDIMDGNDTNNTVQQAVSTSGEH